MGMIIAGHIMGHSGAVDQAQGIVGVLIRCAYILIQPAVNVYVLMSGYFLVNARWDVKRIVLLWLQVFFYSVVCFAVMVLCGVTDFSLSGALKVVLPLSGNQYWFARVFWAFSLFAPFEAMLLRRFTKKQFQFFLGVTLVIFSLWRSFIPFAATVNSEGGNSIMWFCILFALAAYLRLHCGTGRGCGFWAILYGASAALAIASYFVLAFLSDRLGLGGRGTSLFTVYTSITVIVMSVSMFMLFLQCQEKTVSQTVGKCVMFFSSSTYSVYLIHENPYIKRWLWKAIRPETWVGDCRFFLYMLLLVIAILTVCTVVDKLTWLPLKQLATKLPFGMLQKKVDEWMCDTN